MYLRNMRRIVLCIFFLLNLFFCQQLIAQNQIPPHFEFRGVWVATVENIDWPSKKGLTIEEQKAEFIRLAEMHKRNGMNALIVQIRPAGDAFYPSLLEPWSEYLTGKQGVAPIPFYDPLQFMIEETHKLGMEFHAWLNPYRAVFNIHTSSIASSHLTKIHPEWFITYGGKKYFNPGLPQVREFVASVVKDIVTRYDVDAIHMDDYFYPYPIAGIPFPDEYTYKQYGNGLNKADWRRSNCDSIIKLLYQTIRSVKPTVKFGISPFGVWRNQKVDSTGSRIQVQLLNQTIRSTKPTVKVGIIWRNQENDSMGSCTQAGNTCYDDLYANILLWLKNGWIDYVAPQLYWERGHKLCDYDTLLAWWNKYTYGKHLYIGHGVYRAGTNTAWKNRNELPNEINALRKYTTTQGSIYFSSSNFNSNPNGWNDSLQLHYYALPAIVPPMPWIDSTLPSIPIVTGLKNGVYNISYTGTVPMRSFAVFMVQQGMDVKIDSAILIDVIPATQSIVFDRKNIIASLSDRLFVATVSRGNNLSSWVELK